MVRGGVRLHNTTEAADQTTMLPGIFQGPCTKCQPELLCAGQQPIEPGTPSCLPVVCSAVCECRIGLPDVPLPMPIAIVPLTPPEPKWTDPQVVKFCACVGVRLANCGSDLCKSKIKEVMEIVKCEEKATGR